MSGCRSFLTVVLLVSCFTGALGQERLFTVGFKGSFTTGSQLFPTPKSSDPVDRSAFFPIEDVFGLGAEVRYTIPQTQLALGISVDYIRATIQQQIIVGSSRIPVEDGYRVIPIEFTGYFYIPVSGPTFGIYMGGGGGVYLGRRIYRIGGVDSVPIDQGHGFGIHVLGGVLYRLTERFALEAEMKFRDVQFDAVNAFSASEIVYGSTIVNVGREPIPSRIHTDGVVFQLGVAFSL